MTHDAFLRAILDDPDDDAPRLVFADWLEERGDDLGPFIRAQLQLAALPDDDPRRPPLEAEEARLEAGLRQAARSRPLPPWAPKGALWALRDHWGFHRGLIGRLGTTAAKYAAGAAALHRAAPVQRLALRNVVAYQADHGSVFALDELRHLRALDLSGNKLSATGTRALCESPHLRRLKELTLRGCRLRIPEAAEIANTARLPSLEVLRLGVNQLHDTGPEALLAAPQFARLRELDLEHTQLGPRGAAALARSESLERLRLDRNRLGDEGARRLANADGLKRLTHLSLAQNQLTTAGAAEVLSSPALPALTHLDLTGNPLDGSLLGVTPAPPLRGRLRLRLVGPSAIPPEALATSPLVASCVGLDLSSFAFGPAHLRALAESPSAAGLRSLALTGHAVTAAGLAALGAPGALPHLEELRLDGYFWTDELADALLDGGLVPRLRMLHIRVGHVPRRSQTFLARAGELAHLERLTLSPAILSWDVEGGPLREALGWRLRVE